MERGALELNEGNSCRYSELLELSASDDLPGFVYEIEERCSDVDAPSFWYGRRIGSKTMGFEERTPLMIAAMYGSTAVLKYIIESGRIDVNRASGSDGATALHCAAVGGSESSLDIVMLLLDSSADANSVDANGNKPGDLVAPTLLSSCSSRRKTLKMLLSRIGSVDVESEGPEMKRPLQLKEANERREHHIGISLPDINTGIYGTDEFRMYSFKVKPCSRAYSHDWTDCPFAHPGENAKRRDPMKYPYSCVPCPEFRKGSCRLGDACEYAHGIFECWLHPAQYRTRLCKDEIGCNRKVCFFAHKPEELRPIYASTGSAIPSPASLSSSPPDMAPHKCPSSPPPKKVFRWNKANMTTPPGFQVPSSRLRASFNARDLDLETELLGLQNLLSLQQQQQQLMDDMSSISSPVLPQLRASYPRASSIKVPNSSTFMNRSLSFVDRGGAAAAHCAAPMSPNLSDWGSPTGKLDWGIQGEEMRKFNKSVSFAFHGGHGNASMPSSMQEPDVSWVNSLVKDVSVLEHHNGGGVHEQEQAVA